MKSRQKPFARTRAALRRFDVADERLADVGTQAELDAVLGARESARKALGEAFADDTRGINSRENATGVVDSMRGINFVRRIASSEGT